jgi:hypothetical protein
MLLKYRENTAKGHNRLSTHHNTTLQKFVRHWRTWSTIYTCECSSVHVTQTVIHSTLLLLLLLLLVLLLLLSSLSVFPPWRCGPTRAMASSFLTFLDHIKRHTTVGRTPLDKWSNRRRVLYMTTHNTNNRQTDIHVPGGIRNHNLSRRASADPRITSCGHWDRLHYTVLQRFTIRKQSFVMSLANDVTLCTTWRNNIHK